MLPYSENFNKLLTTLKFKIQRNACYYLVEKQFRTDNFNIYQGAVLLPTQIIGENDDDTIFLSIIYKLAPDSKNINDNIAEGIVRMSYENLATLLITGKVEAFYTEQDTKDSELSELIANIRR